MGENEGVRLTPLLFVLAALPLRAERIHVVIALKEPALAEAMSMPRMERWGDGSVFAADIDDSELAQLRSDPRIRAIDIDTGGSGGLEESLPLIGADVLHAQGIDGRGTVVAVLDSGIDTDHPDFAGRLWAEQCYCDNSDGSGCCPGGGHERSGPGAAEDDFGHGTHVSGIAAGAGGVAPGAFIVAVKVLDSKNRFSSFTQIFRALEYIADQRPEVDVINMSLGSDALFTQVECDHSAIGIGMAPVIHRLRERGVLIAAATGNTGSTNRTWIPACMQDVLGVGATYDAPGSHCNGVSTTADDVACFTNSSSSMDILAPGVSIRSSRIDGGLTTMSGTSMATPHVAGTILLMKQTGGRTLAADFIQETLESTGVPVEDTRNHLTFPRLNALAAVNATPHAAQPKRRSARH